MDGGDSCRYAGVEVNYVLGKSRKLFGHVNMDMCEREMIIRLLSGAVDVLGNDIESGVEARSELDIELRK